MTDLEHANAIRTKTMELNDAMAAAAAEGISSQIDAGHTDTGTNNAEHSILSVVVTKSVTL